jgi:SdpI/YfhL protein family
VHLLSLVPLVVGLAIAVVGVLGLRERLPRNRFGGVRTPATMRTDRAFRVANKVAGLPLAVAGAVGAGSGLVGLLGVSLVVAGVGFAGMAGIALAGGILGHRAAEALPDAQPDEQQRELPEGCRGCACGGCEIAKSVGANVSRVGGE